MKRVQVAGFSTSNWRNHVGAVRRVNIYIYMGHCTILTSLQPVSPCRHHSQEPSRLCFLRHWDLHWAILTIGPRSKLAAEAAHAATTSASILSILEARVISLYTQLQLDISPQIYIYIIHWRRRQRSSSPRALSHFLSRTANTHWSTLVV